MIVSSLAMVSRALTKPIALVLLCATSAAGAAEIKVLAGSAVVTVMAELIPRFEQSSGNRVLADFDGAIGQMTERLAKGETADVGIVSGAQIDRLIRDAKVVPGSR